MDGQGIDTIERWTRVLHERCSRHAMTRSLAAAGLAIVPALRGQAAAASCHTIGKRCKHDGQCCSRRCHHGKCRTGGPGTCSEGADLCLNIDPLPCNGGGCSCLQTTAGATRCGWNGAVGSCNGGDSDADCVAAGFGKTSFCVDSGNTCGCPGGSFCVSACPN
jgi:hypothetical protein